MNESWKLLERHGVNGANVAVIDCDNRIVLTWSGTEREFEHEKPVDLYGRIVAVLNACQGTPTEELNAPQAMTALSQLITEYQQACRNQSLDASEPDPAVIENARAEQAELIAALRKSESALLLMFPANKAQNELYLDAKAAISAILARHPAPLRENHALPPAPLREVPRLGRR